MAIAKIVGQGLVPHGIANVPCKSGNVDTFAILGFEPKNVSHASDYTWFRSDASYLAGKFRVLESHKGRGEAPILQLINPFDPKF